MGAEIFDHGAERGSTLSTRALVVAGVALAAVGLGLWAAFASPVEAGPQVALAEVGAVAARPAPAEALVEAAANGDAATVEELLAHGASPDARHAGVSALSAAVRFGHTGLVRRLLAAGARLADEDGVGSDLHVAVRGEDAALVAVLLEAAADATTRDAGGGTPLHVASELGHEHVVRVLLDARADPDARDAAGWTPLARAALLSRPQVARLLLERGADVRAADERGRTPLALACARGELEIARALLAAGADPRAADDRGWTALHAAAAHGRPEIVALVAGVLDQAALAARTQRGATALHLAARHGDARCLERLLAAGIDPRLRDADDRRARDLAPPDASGAPWDDLGLAVPPPARPRPDPVLLDVHKSRPALWVATRATKARAGTAARLHLAVWGDGATLFAPWSTDDKSECRASSLSTAAVQLLLQDLEETGWLELEAPPLDPQAREFLEVAVRHGGGWVRQRWEQGSEPGGTRGGGEAGLPGSGVEGGAAAADWALRKALATDILRAVRPGSAQPLAFALVRGSFRGLSFDAGVRADWLD